MRVAETRVAARSGRMVEESIVAILYIMLRIHTENNEIVMRVLGIR